MQTEVIQNYRSMLSLAPTVCRLIGFSVPFQLIYSYVETVDDNDVGEIETRPPPQGQGLFYMPQHIQMIRATSDNLPCTISKCMIITNNAITGNIINTVVESEASQGDWPICWRICAARG